MFYNTGIATYIWVLNNHKPKVRKGKVQLINAVDLYTKMRKSLGSKRNQIPEAQADEIVKLYGDFEEGEISKIFYTADFGFRRITVERPLQISFYPGDPERRAAMQQDKAWGKWSDIDKTALLTALDALGSDKLPSRDRFTTQLKANGFKATAAQLKFLTKHLAEHDDEAEVCKDSKGNPEPDSDLRDNENVPLRLWRSHSRLLPTSSTARPHRRSSP